MKTQKHPIQRAYWLAVLIAWAFLGQPAKGHAADDRPVVLFVGTSLTAGYGLPSGEAFPALIQDRIEAKGLSYRVVNAGVSGDTSAGGLRRIAWLLQSPIEAMVLELGANDMLRGLDPAKMQANLQQIIDRVRVARPQVKIIIAGMRAAPNLGATYRAQFDAVYPQLAKLNEVALIPFLLEGVAGKPKLNQVDGIHPTAEGHRVIAELVWLDLEGLLGENGD